MGGSMYQCNSVLLDLGFYHIEDFFYYSISDEIYSSFFKKNQLSIIVDFNICSRSVKSIFNYELYTQHQNEYMNLSDRCYRIYYNPDTFKEELDALLSNNQIIEFTRSSYSNREISAIDNSALESIFENRFEDVYGLDALEYVYKEFGILDYNGRQVFMDFVVETNNGYIAVEENGVTYHHPQLIGIDDYKKQLSKQNTFCKYGAKVFRWSSNDCLNNDKINDEILKFFGPRENFINKGLLVGERSFKLYQHQEDTLQQIVESRKNGVNSFLVVFPTATGKSKIVEEDIKQLLMDNPLLKICITSPTVSISDDWINRMTQLANSVKTELSIGKTPEFQICCSTYYVLWSNIHKLPADYFDYIVVDEAHHAVAPMMKRALQYFTPQYLLGMTATPFRKDTSSLEDIFGSYQVQLSLEEAMEKDIIVKARAFRIISNIDLSEVRFNGKHFINSDLEKTVRVNSRNELIADVLRKYFSNGMVKDIQGIVFCVSISHAEEMARVLNSVGLSAESLSSNSKNASKILEDYKNKKVRFLCSCSMISEGWDSPQTSIVVMARPTLSKTLYIQQLGRGFRKYLGKECLFVIDVVDQYGSLAIPWSMNSLFNNPYYVPFGNITKPGDMTYINGLSEKVQKIEEINLSTFESNYGDYLSLEQSARELYIGTATLLRWVLSKSVPCDLIIPFGSSKLYMFKPATIDTIRDIKKLTVHSDETIHQDFFDFLNEKIFTFSFKLIFMLALFKSADQNGEAALDDIRVLYIKFYQERIDLGLHVDREICIYTKEYLGNEKVIKNSILTNPFEKFERKRFIYYSKDLAKISFNTTLWNSLSETDMKEIEKIQLANLDEYYENLDHVQDIHYLRRFL